MKGSCSFQIMAAVTGATSIHVILFFSKAMNDNETDTVLMMALQLGQMQAGFLGQTAHELRSPMSHIMSLQQLILADLCEDPAEEREFIRQCYAASQKFMTLMDLVIDVSKLAYGASKPKEEEFDWLDVMLELAQIFGVRAKNANLILNFPEITDHNGLMATGDRQRSCQFLAILLSTTINETETGQIDFKYETQGDRLNFEISCRHPENFWNKADTADLSLPTKPTLDDLKSIAEKLEFSPALKWHLCETLSTKLGGGLAQVFTVHKGVIQVMGWLPLMHRK